MLILDQYMHIEYMNIHSNIINIFRDNTHDVIRLLKPNLSSISNVLNYYRNLGSLRYENEYCIERHYMGKTNFFLFN